MVLLGNSTKKLKEEVTSILYDYFQKEQKEKEYILTHSEFRINLISRVEQDRTRRKNLRPVSLMNTDEI